MKVKAFLKLIILSFLAMVVMAGCSGSKGTTGPQGPTGVEPVITNITPMASVNTVVTITGQNFSPTQGAGKVWMNGIDAGTAISWTDTQITIKPPASLISGNGFTEIVIANVAVNQLASNAVAFELIPSGTAHLVDTMYYPKFIVSDPSTNLLYATDVNNHVVKIDPSGIAQVIATGLLAPQGIVFTNGTLYVAEATADASGNYWLKAVSTNGKITPWASTTFPPYGMTNDNSGNLYVTYPANGSVYEYTINGYGSQLTNLGAGTLIKPQGIAYANGYLYIAANNNIAKYNIATGNLNTTWAQYICETNYADGVVYQPSQNALLVSCSDTAPNNTISKVNGVGTGAGTVIRKFISTSKGDSPLGMTFDMQGNLYVANSGDFMVTKVTFTGAGAPNTIAWFAAGPDGFYGNIGTDNAGNAYIPVYLHNLIVKLTPDNKTSIYASSDSITGGQAIGCTFSSNGVLLIADGNAKKIETAPAGGGTINPWIDVSGLGVPYDVAVDGSGNVFVDINMTKIAKYDASGTLVSASFVSGLNGFYQILTQGNTLTIPDTFASNLKGVSSAGSNPVTPTILMNSIQLLAVSPAPSGQFYGTDNYSNIFLINPNTSSASYLTKVNGLAHQIATMSDGSLITVFYGCINRVYP